MSMKFFLLINIKMPKWSIIIFTKNIRGISYFTKMLLILLIPLKHHDW